MAISGVVYSPYQTKWGISQESEFGTAIGDDGTYEQFEGPVPSVNYGLIRRMEPAFGDGRVRSGNTEYISDNGGTREISFSDMMVRRADLATLLYAVCQNVSEAAGDPYQKDIDITNTTTQPDFASDAGYFATLGIYDPIAGNQRKYTSCVLRELTLSADLSGDGLLRAGGTWISSFAATQTADFDSPGSTWAYNTQTYYDYHSPTTKTIAATDVVVYGWNLTITNNATRVGDNAGDCETYAMTLYDVTGEITVKYDANSDGLLGSMAGGTQTTIQLTIGTEDQAGYFDISIPGAVLGDISHDYGDERGTAITIPFTAVESSNNLANFEVTDGTDQTW